jgi:uncharacterized protein
MKQLFACCLVLFVSSLSHGSELADRIAAVPNPRQNSSWISDPTGVITRRHGDINQLITSLEHETSTEIAIVVLPTIGQLVPKEFAVALLQQWGVGKADKDNGVLVLHILDQRRIEIETGYGIEGALPDIKAHWITEEIAVPFFKKNSFADGHYEVVRALVRAIRQSDINRAGLVNPLETQPGENSEALPNIPAHDAITLKHSSFTDRIFYSNWTPLVLVALSAIVYLLVSAMVWLRSIGKGPYAKYQLFNTGFSRLQYTATLPAAASAFVVENSRTETFFSPLPVLLALGFFVLRRRDKTLDKLRNAPRVCQCGKPMRRLSEKQDDAYLEKGQVAEESVASVDYDVWRCACGQITIEPYRGNSAAVACSQCRFLTFRETNGTVLRAATTSSSGLRAVTYACAHCSYTKIVNETIPQESASTSSGSSSSDSSGSSGGSSFGGGSSGGGGAGSSY